jgi:hypothetical protein
MGVSIFYLLAVVPLLVGGYFWYKSHEVVWQEWLGGSAAGFLTAGIFHVLAITGMTGDVETWSGQIDTATFHPEWVERYTVTHHHSSGTGKNRRTWTTTETKYRTHHEHWTAETTVDDTHEITEAFFREIVNNFGGGTETRKVHKTGFHSGDPNVYVANNRTGYVYPVTTRRSWENRVKAAPSLFSYTKVPTNVAVHPWPSNPDWRVSERLVGTASVLFDKREFDLMNSRLGPVKRVNVIMVGWTKEPAEISQYQEAAWIGGKKNDLVICFGGMTTSRPATWSRVFGWTESELCKRNLASIMLRPMDANLRLAEIEKEIERNYRLKDWSKFDYITIEPPTWSYFVYIFVLAGSQVGLYVFFHRNEFSKDKWRRFPRQISMRNWPRL